MLSQQQKQAIRDFYTVLEDRPLEPYEPFYEARLHSAKALGRLADPVDDWVNKIEWGNGTSVSLVSGQRGAGKSTELRRMRKRLTDADNLVFLIDLSDYLHPTQPLDITDFLIVLMGAFSDIVSKEYKIDPLKTSYWERCLNLVHRDVKAEITVKAGVDLKLALKENPSFKRELQKKMSEQISQLLASVKGFAAEMVKLIRQESGEKNIVLLIDSLEKIRGIGVDAPEVHKSIENLFNDNSQHLSFQDLNIIYSVPPYLTTLAPGVNRSFGSVTWTLANAHIYHESGEPDPRGVGLLRSLIAKRYANWPQIIAEPQLDRCILATGGDLRDLFRMLRLVLLPAVRLESLPVPDSLIGEIEATMRRDMLPLPAEDLTWLKRIRQPKEHCLAKKEELHRLAHFFDSNLVQCYRNGKDWYDVHPLLRQVIESAEEE